MSHTFISTMPRLLILKTRNGFDPLSKHFTHAFMSNRNLTSWSLLRNVNSNKSTSTLWSVNQICVYIGLGLLLQTRWYYANTAVASFWMCYVSHMRTLSPSPPTLLCHPRTLINISVPCQLCETPPTSATHPGK